MGPPTVVLDLRVPTGTAGFLLPLAAGGLWSDVPVGPSWRQAERSPRPDRPEPPTEEPAQIVYDGPGLVDGGIRRIRSRIGPRGDRRVEFEDGESFWIAASGDRILRRSASPPRPARTVERALGGPLALALSGFGVFLLHASAVAGRRGVVALTGGPGRGKSTLAAAARSFPELSLTRVADDQLPVRLEPRPLALPHFPQLKLGEAEGYPARAAAERPLAALVEIAHAPDRRRVELERASPAEACLALARATAASRLFDPALLERHFAHCAQAARELPVLRLRYPSGTDRLGEPLAALAELA